MDDRLSVRSARLAYPERDPVDLYIPLFAAMHRTHSQTWRTVLTDRCRFISE
jgi:hypothetical protein